MIWRVCCHLPEAARLLLSWSTVCLSASLSATDWFKHKLKVKERLLRYLERGRWKMNEVKMAERENWGTEIWRTGKWWTKSQHNFGVYTRHGTGSLGHQVNGSFGSSFTSGSPGRHFDPEWDPSFSGFRKKAQDKDIKIYSYFCEYRSNRHWNIDI